ncbi:hypothetical protein ACKKBF_B37550 [Auxenochlorella protothecoides x Auxenochlorella symbiontica]|uniref:Uncharacterized protein n=2 Tax=Auxenochlorella protothecoides TaxID=3075 RepID=A0A3M7KXM2_AUXPR|nr:hypothetical protein APUTEX25_005632 [Auxenochlorella protothecoides]|eukprot:RMZ53886.1 hypothetical protein APUTEX25_005632 [Auxenochlorella protothecoides]
MDSLKGLAGKYLGTGEQGAEGVHGEPGTTASGGGGFRDKLTNLAEGYLNKKPGPIDPNQQGHASVASAEGAIPTHATPGGLEGKAASGQTGQPAAGASSYIEKAKDAARSYLDKHPVEEGGAPKAGIAGYLDKAKVAAKDFLDKPAGTTGEAGAGGHGGGFGAHTLVEKLLGLFKKEEGRELEPGKESDYGKLSQLASKYLGTQLSPETLKGYVSSFLGKGKAGGATASSTAAPAVPAPTL